MVTSKTDKERWALFAFLRSHGVEICRSEDFQAIGNFSPNKKDLVGVVGYNGFVGNTCMMHCAGDGNWVTRNLLWAAFDYPFTQCKVEHIVASVAADNAKALAFNRHLGFEVLHRLRDGWTANVDLVVMRMERNQCRWLTRLEKRHELQAA